MDFNDSAQEAAFRAVARAFLEAHAPADVGNPYAEPTPERARTVTPPG